MRPVSNSFSIIVLGAWNPSIFSPEWVSNYLLNDKEENVEIAFSIDDPTAPRKITFEGITLFPGRRQLHLTSSIPNLDGIKKCSEVLLKVLSQLGHTPIFKAGLNFSFSEEGSNQALVDALSPSDDPSILDGYSINNTRIDRSLSSNSNNDYVLNLSIAQKEDAYSISFNFHYESVDIDKCKEIFVDPVIDEHFDSAIVLAKNAYNIELEE